MKIKLRQYRYYYFSVKADFIRAKHQQCIFTFKPSNDGIVCVENELGKQLHGSVRISNLETSFRLLINGADPNYFHDVSQMFMDKMLKLIVMF